MLHLSRNQNHTMIQDDLANYYIWTSTDKELVEIAESISKLDSEDVELRASVRLFNVANNLRRDGELLLLRAINVIRARYPQPA